MMSIGKLVVLARSILRPSEKAGRVRMSENTRSVGKGSIHQRAVTLTRLARRERDKSTRAYSMLKAFLIPKQMASRRFFRVRLRTIAGQPG